MIAHESASARFVTLVNQQVSQGMDYHRAWMFVRQHNPKLYAEMTTEGAPQATSLGNASPRDAAEIERLRAVIKYTSRQITDMANSLMASHGWTFERSWMDTKRSHPDLHERMSDANRKVMQLVNAKPAGAIEHPGHAQVIQDTQKNFSGTGANADLVARDILNLPSGVFSDGAVMGPLLDMGTAMVSAVYQVELAKRVRLLPKTTFAKLLTLAAKEAQTLDKPAGDPLAYARAKWPALAKASDEGIAA